MNPTHRHNRGGRPLKPLPDRRNHVIAVKVNDAELAVIRQGVEKAGMKPGPYLRELALKGRVLSRVSKEETRLLAELSLELRNTGINLNTIARRAGSGVPDDYGKELQRFIKMLGTIIDHYYDKLI